MRPASLHHASEVCDGPRGAGEQTSSVASSGRGAEINEKESVRVYTAQLVLLVSLCLFG